MTTIFINLNIRRRIGISILTFFALFAFYVFAIEPNLIIVTKVAVVDRQLASVLHDKKLVHISDLHLKKIGLRENLLLSRINALHPDFVFITGDILDEGLNDVGPFIEFFEKIQSSHGIFAVPGNTDYYFTNFPDMACKVSTLKKTKVNLLINDNLKLQLLDRVLYIVGVDDPVLGYDNLRKAMVGVPEDVPVILLAHSADVLEPRGKALSIRMSKFKGEKLNSWRWCDDDYSVQQPKVFCFKDDGLHSMRVQRGVHEVCIGKIILRRYTEADLSPFEKPKQLGDIVMDIGKLKENKIFGSWKKVKDDCLPWKFKIFDSESSHIVEPYALVSPENYFETTFEAERGVYYKVWAMLSSINQLGHDQIWVQFSDSLNSSENPMYQIRNDDYENEQKNINLTLAGHTHGGQFRFPFQFYFIRLNRYGNKYIHGLYQTLGGHLYVTRGIGTNRFPVRLCSPPEVTLFSFVKDT